jgi:DNA-directed RNA polymerase specialized sigma subunit
MKIERPRFGMQDNNSEIAKELQITEKGVDYIKNTALAKAKAMLKKQGYKATDFFEESKDE